MAKKVTLGSIKRFGTRYGASKKLKFAQVEVSHRGKHKCPYCNYVQAKRIAAGIWMCKKCNIKFAAKAYSLALAKTQALPTEKASEKVSQEMPEEVDEEVQTDKDFEAEDVQQEA